MYSDHDFQSDTHAREANFTSRSTALSPAAAPVNVTHIAVRISPRKQRPSRLALKTLAAVAHTSHPTIGRSRAASTAARGPPDRGIVAQPRRCEAWRRSRARQRAHGRLPARQSAGCAAAGCQADVAAKSCGQAPAAACSDEGQGLVSAGADRAGTRRLHGWRDEARSAPASRP